MTKRSDATPPPRQQTSAPTQISVPKIAHVVAGHLRRRIISGQLPPGSTLPPEAQLMASFGVSRPALREALRILEAETLIAIGRGVRGGASILPPSLEKAAQHGTFYLVSRGSTLQEIHEARSLIEPAAAAQLAAQGSPEAVAALRQCIAEGRTALDDGDLKRALVCSNAFHTRLVQFSANKALGLLVGVLHDVSEADYTALDEHWRDPQTKQQRLHKAFTALDRLLSLIASGEVEETDRFWRLYMARTGLILTESGHAGDRITLDTTRSD